MRKTVWDLVFCVLAAALLVGANVQGGGPAVPTTVKPAPARLGKPRVDEAFTVNRVGLGMTRAQVQSILGPGQSYKGAPGQAYPGYHGKLQVYRGAMVMFHGGLSDFVSGSQLEYQGQVILNAGDPEEKYRRMADFRGVRVGLAEGRVARVSIDGPPHTQSLADCPDCQEDEAWWEQHRRDEL